MYFETPIATKFVLTKSTNPIVIIRTTGGPAKHYAWAQELHKIRTNSVLTSLTSDGHTGRGQGSSSIDNQADAYLLHAATSKEIECKVD